MSDGLPAEDSLDKCVWLSSGRPRVSPVDTQGLFPVFSFVAPFNPHPPSVAYHLCADTHPSTTLICKHMHSFAGEPSRRFFVCR